MRVGNSPLYVYHQLLTALTMYFLLAPVRDKQGNNKTHIRTDKLMIYLSTVNFSWAVSSDGVYNTRAPSA